ncbi:hypothetical protein Vi05172_g6628 [Venturia inaequalis]|nr:hypothetical protein Vi05172_g6628 [Venturia inaequalis]
MDKIEAMPRDSSSALSKQNNQQQEHLPVLCEESTSDLYDGYDPKRAIFPFMKLAGELRNRIYGFCLRPQNGHFRFRAPNRQTTSLQSFDCSRTRIKLATQLLTVNREISEEALSFIYVQAMSFGTIQAYEAFADKVGVHNLARVHEIKIEVLNCSSFLVPEYGLPPVEAWPYCILSSLQAAGRISELQKPVFVAHLQVYDASVLRHFLDIAGENTLNGVMNLSISRIDLDNDDPEVFAQLPQLHNLQTLNFNSWSSVDMSVEGGVLWGQKIFKLMHVWLKQLVITEEVVDVLNKKLSPVGTLAERRRDDVGPREALPSSAWFDTCKGKCDAACGEMARLLAVDGYDPKDETTWQ